MGEEKPWDGKGFCIPDQRLTFANLDAGLSSYTQAGERPGTAVGSDSRSRLTPMVTGEQGADLDVYAGRAGYAKTDPVKSGGLLAKDQTEDDYLGWNPPSVIERSGKLVNGIVGLDQSDLAGFRYGPFAQQKALCLNYAEDATAEPVTYVYDAESHGMYWTSQGDVVTDSTRRYWDASLTQLPDGRWLCIILSELTATGVASWAMYMSDDDGDNWSLYDDDPFNLNGALPDTLAGDTSTANTRNAVSKLRACPDGSVVFVRFQETTGDAVNQQFTQWASPGLGSAFVNVDDWTISSPGTGDEFDFDLDVTPGGKVVLLRTSDATTASGTGKMVAATVGSAFAPLGDATEVDVYDADTGWRCGLTVLPTGVIVTAHCSSSDGDVKRFESYDDGATWRELGASLGNTYDGDFVDMAGSVTFMDWQMCPLGGGVMAVYATEGASGDTTNNDEPQWMLWGGWTSMEYNAGDLPSVVGPRSSVTWLPVELPGSLTAWTNQGAGATRDIGSDGFLTITNAAFGNGYHRSASLSTAHDALFVFTFAVTAGGSVSVPRTGVRMYTTDGTNEWQIYVSASTGGYTVYDVNGGTFDVNIAPDMTDPREILVWMSGDGTGSIVVADRLPGERYWTQRLDSTLSSTAGTTGYVDWGNIFGSNTTASEWLRVQYVVSSADAVGTLRPRFDTTTAPTLRGLPMPLVPVFAPFGNSDGASYLSVEGGPGRYAETWAIAREYDYPARAMFTEVSPSPSKVWKPTDTTDQDFVWDIDHESPLAQGEGSIFVRVHGIADWTLSGWNGSAWESIAASTNAANSITLTITGDTGEPTGGVDDDHPGFVWRNELAGGLLSIDPTGDDIKRTIAGNSAGVTYLNTSSKRASIRLAEVDGSEGSEYSCVVIWPDTVRIVHNVDSYSRYRFRVDPDTLVTDLTHTQIGSLMIGAFIPFGQQPSLGTTTSLQANASSRRNRYGTSYVRQDGPPARTVTMQWPDAADLYQIRQTNASPDYIEASTGSPLAAYQDVPFWLHATFEELKSGQIPVVLVTDAPESGGTITDPTTFVYGRMTRVGDLTLRLGDEGASEVYGIGATIIEEIK